MGSAREASRGLEGPTRTVAAGPEGPESIREEWFSGGGSLARRPGQLLQQEAGANWVSLEALCPLPPQRLALQIMFLGYFL